MRHFLRAMFTLLVRRVHDGERPPSDAAPAEVCQKKRQFTNKDQLPQIRLRLN